MIKKILLHSLAVLVFLLFVKGSVVHAEVKDVQSRYEAYVQLEQIIEMYNGEQYFDKAHEAQMQKVPANAKYPYQDNELEDIYLRIYDDIEEFPKTQTKMEFLRKYGRENPESSNSIETCDAIGCTFTGESDVHKIAQIQSEIIDQKQMLVRNIDFAGAFVLAKYINVFNDGDSGNSGYDLLSELNSLETQMFSKNGTGFMKDDPGFSAGNLITMDDFYFKNKDLLDVLTGKRSLTSVGSLVSTENSADTKKKIDALAGTLKSSQAPEIATCKLTDSPDIHKVDVDLYGKGIAEKLIALNDSEQTLNAYLQLSQGFKLPVDTYPDSVGSLLQLKDRKDAKEKAAVENASKEKKSDMDYFGLNLRKAQDAFNKFACLQAENQPGPDGKQYVDAAIDLCTKLEFVFSTPRPADYGLAFRPLSLISNFESLKTVAEDMASKNNMTRSFPRNVFTLPWLNMDLELRMPRIEFIKVPIFANVQPSVIFNSDTFTDAKNNVNSLSDKISLVMSREDYSENITTYAPMIEQFLKEKEQDLQDMKKTALVRSYIASSSAFQKLIGQKYDAMSRMFDDLKEQMRAFAKNSNDLNNKCQDKECDYKPKK